MANEKMASARRSGLPNSARITPSKAFLLHQQRIHRQFRRSEQLRWSRTNTLRRAAQHCLRVVLRAWRGCLCGLLSCVWDCCCCRWSSLRKSKAQQDDAEAEDSSSSSDQDELSRQIEKAGKERRDAKLHAFVKNFTESSFFQNGIMITILVNAVFLSLDSFRQLSFMLGFLLAVDEVFLAIYTLEFIFKVYAEPTGYWKSGFNIFDFVILAVSLGQDLLAFVSFGNKGVSVFRILRAFRTLRTLRSVSFSSNLQVLVGALLYTLTHNVLSVVLLLLLVMYLFAIVGYHLFRENDEYWGSLGKAMMSLLCYVTVDGWTELVSELEAKGWKGIGRIYTVFFICVGYLLFSNIFVGIILMNVQETTKTHQEKQSQEKELSVKEKKKCIQRSQAQETVGTTLENNKDEDFATMADAFEKSLRHDDFTCTRDIFTSPAWIHKYVKSLDYTQHTSERYKNMLEDLGGNLMEAFLFNAATGRIIPKQVEKEEDVEYSQPMRDRESRQSHKSKRRSRSSSNVRRRYSSRLSSNFN